MAGCKTIRMEKQIEVRLQKAFSQGRERLRVELFKDWPVQSTMRVGMATKVEYARDGREKKRKERRKKQEGSSVSKTDRRNTDVYRHPGGPLSEGFDLTRHLGEERSSSWLLCRITFHLTVFVASSDWCDIRIPCCWRAGVVPLSCGGAVMCRPLAEDRPPRAQHQHDAA